MSRAPLVVLALALALLLPACGEKEVPAGERPREPFTLLLDYFPNADHAGIYAAQAAGEYERAGLDVRIQAPPDPSAPLRLLQAGRTDLAISYEPEVLLARDRGAELVSVSALVSQPLTSLVSLDPRIRTPRDLRGKRVGTAGIPYQSAYLRTILTEAGVDPATVREINVGFNLIAPLLTRRVDAVLGAFWNYEAVDLRLRGRRPVVQRMERLGVPPYDELVFTARRQDLDEDGASRLRRFLQATARGHERLRENPGLGVDALLEANEDLDRRLQEAVVRTTLPTFFPQEQGRPFGWQDPTQWRDYGEWMLRNRLVRRPPNAGRAVTNEFLPGEGLDPEPAGRD